MTMPTLAPPTLRAAVGHVAGAEVARLRRRRPLVVWLVPTLAAPAVAAAVIVARGADQGGGALTGADGYLAGARSASWVTAMVLCLAFAVPIAVDIASGMARHLLLMEPRRAAHILGRFAVLWGCASAAVVASLLTSALVTRASVAVALIDIDEWQLSVGTLLALVLGAVVGAAVIGSLGLLLGTVLGPLGILIGLTWIGTEHLVLADVAPAASRWLPIGLATRLIEQPALPFATVLMVVLAAAAVTGGALTTACIAFERRDIET